MKYLARDKEIDAIRWSGNNAEKIQEWLGADLDYDLDNDNRLCFGKMQTPPSGRDWFVMVEAGDWILRYSFGGYGVAPHMMMYFAFDICPLNEGDAPVPSAAP